MARLARAYSRPGLGQQQRAGASSAEAEPKPQEEPEPAQAQPEPQPERQPEPRPEPTPEPRQEPTPEPAACGRFEDLLMDTDVIGELIGEESAASVDHCCGLCNRRAGCEGFAYLDTFHMCYLKAHLSGTYAKEGSLARMRPGATAPRDDPAVLCMGYSELREDTDLAGDLLAAVHGASPTQCCMACEEAAGCRGFAFLDEHKQCYLKANVTGTFEKMDCVARTKMS
uniref:Apple domain-containing protein n=1 Tax=Alexandrium catenella TaxID=2925 RepID=A0A7S1RCH1_ALECA